MAVNWSYYSTEKISAINEKYLPRRGEGENQATQSITAINKLVYKWYNDGDVFDNTDVPGGWYNDLSTYANWLANHIPGTYSILSRVRSYKSADEYEEILRDVADLIFDWERLEELEKLPATGSIYECDGVFHFSPDRTREYDPDDDEWW